jgi:hypothetical protein
MGLFGVVDVRGLSRFNQARAWVLLEFEDHDGGAAAMVDV